MIALLAVARAISLFGFQSGAALATVVGVLVEVPVMLSVVKIVNVSARWYARGAGLLVSSSANAFLSGAAERLVLWPENRSSPPFRG